ncbi:carbohydrate ABC transporter permease [Fundicoccus culcitae]|uniref:Carbohydrate ABC transporter permease n=2 Tax=Fundicoccus culcitae TaxID=2969821 RepID=A0ABY5PA51_9LACT|nr:carbohydrate ABC transporter permease [Fundicoccus culcitae]UUX35506.1 carbohydrate ABC transporter permease [Fundicoccus culcitae]
MSQDWDSRIFDFVNVFLLITFTLIIVVPLWNIVISSFATGQTLAKGDFVFLPDELSLDNYRTVLRDDSILRAFMISVAKTVIGVVTHVFFCAMMAYPMSKAYLKGRKVYSAMGITTMFFGGGMIPTYLLIRSLGLLNSFWVYIIPALLSYYDVIILMNFFRSVPDSLEESAMIDGAGYWRIFLQIILPLSKPSLATIALFNGVNQWNDFMTARLYITDRTLYPLQMRLYEIIVQSQTNSAQNIGTAVAQTTTKGVQLATIVITTVPIILIYPMLQKYFISGMMVGAVKE